MVAVGRGEMKLEVKCVWWNTSDPVETTVKRGATGVDLCLQHCESRTEGDLSINARLDVAAFPGALSERADLRAWLTPREKNQQRQGTTKCLSTKTPSLRNRDILASLLVLDDCS